MTVLRKRQRPRRETGIPRPRSIAMKRITRDDLKDGAYAVRNVDTSGRPRTRAECVGASRPCPWIACKHHLYLDVDPRNGTIKFNRPDLEPDELEDSCALDIADSGGTTPELVGLKLNMTRERVRQIEVVAAFKMKAAMTDAKIFGIDGGDPVHHLDCITLAPRTDNE
jgi:hypothetical protein